MEMEGNNNPNVQSLYDQCRKMMNYHVILRMKDGSEVDGMIENVEPDHVDVLVGEDVVFRDDENQNSMQRQYGGQYGSQYGSPYGNPYRNPRRYRRFRRRRYPYANLLAMSLLPYPYYAPPYSYYPYYPYSY